MLKIIKSYLPLIFIVIAITALLIASFKEDIAINEYTADIVIDDEGDMHVTETWDMTYSGDYNVRFRDIKHGKYPSGYPFEKSSNNYAEFVNESTSVQVLKNGVDITDQVRFGYSYNNDYDELNERVRCVPFSTNCESIFSNLTSAGGLTGDITFIYTYEIAGVVTEYNDIAEINWTMFEYAESKVEQGTINITLPANTNNPDEFYLYSHQTKNTTTTIVSSNQFKVEFSNLITRDVLAFRLLIPTDVFTSVRDRNKVDFTSITKTAIIDFEEELVAKMETRAVYEEMALYVPVILSAVMVLIAFLLNITMFGAPKVVVEESYYKPPTDHSPAQIGYLLNDRKFKNEVFTATLLDLVRRGYIDILNDNYEVDNTDIIFKKKEDIDVNELRPHERHLITWIFDGVKESGQVLTSDIEDYASNKEYSSIFIARYSEFKEKVTHEGMRASFFNDKIETKKLVSMLFNMIPLSMIIVGAQISSVYNAVIPLMFILPILTIIAFSYFIIKQNQLSQTGQEALVKWGKYKEYLTHATNYDNASLADVTYWDEAIVYATVLGVASNVMEQLELKGGDAKPDQSNMHRSRVFYPTHMYYHRHRHTPWRNVNRSFKRSVSSARINVRAAQAASSGGRSSGGFSGGSFGGGGGGGRSR